MTLRFAGVLAGVLLIAAQASAAPLQIGESRPFGMDDIDLVGTIHRLLSQKLHGEYMAPTGTVKRVSEGEFLVCGFYFNTKNLNPHQKLKAFAMRADHMTGQEQVFAPLTPAEQEAKGCWAGDRERLNAEINKLLHQGADK